MKKLLIALALLASTAVHARVYIEFEAKDAEGKVLSKPALLVDEGNSGVITLGKNRSDHTLKAQYKLTVIKEYANYAHIHVEVSFSEEITTSKKSMRQATLSEEIELPYGETVDASLPNTDSNDAPIFVSFTVYAIESHTMPQTTQHTPKAESNIQNVIQQKS